MGVSVVIISRNQAASLPLMLAALEAQVPGFERVWVLDRCTDASYDFLDSEHEENIVVKDKGRGFEAGKARNMGQVRATLGNHLLFLDGDRIPNGLSHELVLKALGLYDFTLIKAEVDAGRTWFTEEFTENPGMGYLQNSFYTCGTLIRDVAVEAVSDLQGGVLFHPLLDGAYGHEDLYLGDVAYHLGMSCGGFPSSCYLSGAVGVLDADYKHHRMAEQIALRTSMRKMLRHRPDDGPVVSRQDMRSRLLHR